MMRILFLLLLSSTFIQAAGALSPSLFNGQDFAAWEIVAGTTTDLGAVCAYSPAGTVNVTGKPAGFFSTRDAHKDCRLHVEWRWAATPGNGGVLLHISSGPRDRQWPLSFQVQTKHKSAGDLLPMAGATFAEPLTSAPGANPQIRARSGTDSEAAAGEWNACDIICRGDTIEVNVNGVLQNRVSGCSLTAGKIGFQLEGAPFELRNVTLEPLR